MNIELDEVVGLDVSDDALEKAAGGALMTGPQTVGGLGGNCGWPTLVGTPPC